MPTDLACALDALSFHEFRVELDLAQPLALAAHRRAILWRGAFGTTFRSLVCHDPELACDACSLRPACPFARTFAPTIPEGRPEIARLRDPPRPFVLVDPHPEAPMLPAGGTALGMVVVGRALASLPYFVVSLRRLGEIGLGPQRTRFSLAAVRATDAAGIPRAVVYQQGSPVVRLVEEPLRARDLTRPADGEARRIRVRFVTPTDLRGEGEAGGGRAPRFGTLVRRARDRASALATFFGDGALDLDPRALAESADGVATLAEDTVASSTQRTSSRTGQRHEIGGVLGSATYEGPGVAKAMPWLRLAEKLGVGKHATFGSGRIGVEVLA